MTQKQISALITFGVVAGSTVLCWPGDFTVASALYRAIVINIINVFVTEIPNFKKGKNTIRNIIKSCLTILGFILVGIGLLRIYSDKDVATGEYIYFFASALACCVSLMNFIDSMIVKNRQTPAVTAYDPAEVSS